MSGRTKIVEMMSRLLNIIPSWGAWLERKFTLLNLLDKEKSFILDVGCGSSYLPNLLTKCGKSVVAVDIKKMKPNGGEFDYVIASAEQLPFKKNIFDHIICSDVIEHVKNDKLAAKEMGRVLQKGGKIALTTTSNFWKFPYYEFMKPFTLNEAQTLKSFGHIRRGYGLSRIKSLFRNFKIEEVRYFINKISALGYDIEFSRLYILENIVLKFLALPLFLNFKLSSKKHGTHIGVRLRKN